ncbi:RNA polymerase sigma-70 factor [Mucilaginibacter endophyticus]|uniref:RNA polymerase sigma-70 factor n=1 Tax=Mucilaginibacter endophyticus TaxID=2675003 RepID=UPI001379B5B6|nr:RNA polymerase sigma-70 factor [Mucilaginibacter endophyticus]
MADKINTILNEREILDRLKDLDQGAFTTIYNAYSKQIYRYAIRFVKSNDIAEDAVHDIFVKLWNNAADLDIQVSIQSYLYRLAHNHLLNLIRREAVEGRYIDEIMNNATEFSQNTEETIQYRETLAKTQQAIDNLPPQRKLIFEMGRGEGMSHKQIARELNIADSTVNNQIVKALKSIKEHLLATGAIGAMTAFILLLKK